MWNQFHNYCDADGVETMVGLRTDGEIYERNKRGRGAIMIGGITLFS